ncbi:ribose-5-phosphate isomerase rki1 [Coemansia javaensis]|uniref:Ribose-5-phosphate isomerase n=1 Tax=Coemansia javaensis TaxID=2761396 RepID=A0A9W8LDP3_9FUNG|nr:ribose-5-phosphate isomerase rki1 [Coemansia javaensis]
MGSADLVAQAKRAAAFAAVNKHVTPDVRVLGVGTGSTVVFVVERLAELRAQGQLHPELVCVPTSFQSSQLIVAAGLRPAELNDLPADGDGLHAPIDVTIDGADEVDAELNVIKGGGAAHLREKVVAAASRALVIVGDSTKDARVLGDKWAGGVPVEVAPLAWRTAKAQIERIALPGAFELAAPAATLRQAVRKAGPVVTDNGNFVLDVCFGRIHDPPAVERRVMMVPGVVEVGIFSGMACEAWFGNEDGTIACRIPQSMAKKHE